ncbi:MAG: PEP-utilizing enzyme, partial [archaeon]|nr:PEP-utilizing enzyme [archaeon]
MVSKEVKAGQSVFVKWFSELSNKDVPIAGGKGASLAEMYNAKFPIPPGFVITAQAYSHFIASSGITEKMKEIISRIDIEDTKKLDEATKEIREIISGAEMTKDLEEEILEAYDVLSVDKNAMQVAKGSALAILKHSYEPPFVAVRSSATTEDLAEASFAGQQESFLNVKGKAQLIQKVKECMASLFTSRATYYREKKGFGQEKAQLAVVVMKMVDSDKSGVMFSRSPVGDENTIMIEAVWGLGEGIVSGRIKPDSYIIDRNLDNFKIIDQKISEKKVAIVRAGSGENQIVKLTPERAKQQVLDNHELKMLAGYAERLEEHYKKPQDIEFAIEGKEILIVQSRPITTLGGEKKAAKQVEGKVLASGLGASPGVSSGSVKIVHTMDDLDKVKKGDVLVTEMTNPDMVVTMQRAAAIVTDEGGITSHAAIVSREMGIPAVVGTGNATKILKDEQVITVDGNAGRVIEGKGETKLAEV